MTDSTRPNLEARIDRYVWRELTAAQARELAQESLDSPELFEELTSTALAKAALSARPVPGGGRIVRFPRKARFVVAGAAAAAAVVLVSLYSLRPFFLRQDQPSLTQNRSQETAASPRLRPALAFSADPGQPVLLASGLQPAPAGREGTPVFRGPEPASRSPLPAGAIVSIEDGLATISLGSLDGLRKGSELQVFRDVRSTVPVGRMLVTTVFRERARGRILAGKKIQVNDQVRVAGAAHLAALLDQVNALARRGDRDAARRMAERAVQWAETADVSPRQRGKVLERLAALEYQAGSLQAAQMHYRSAVDSLNAEPQAPFGEQSAAWNNLAVLHLLGGDFNGAEAPLSRAVSTSPKTDIAYGRSVNNLGVLAELRGDRRKAEALYADALRAFAGIADSPAQERQVVETNLARIRGVR